MIQIKNLRPSRLLISDAGLKLLPGQVATVANLSPQAESLIARGYIARLDKGEEIPTAKDSKTKPETLPPVPKEYENLHAPEAIEFVSGLNDTQVLQAILNEEPRKTVREAINERLAELG